MATRNLTARFRRARSAAVRTAGPGPSAPGYDTSALVGDEPEYVHEVQAINESIEEIDGNMEKLKALHEERMKATIGDTSDLEMRVDALTRELTSQFSRAGRRLKAMSPLETAGDRKSGDASVQANIQRALAMRLQQKSMTFRKAQRRYMSEVNKRKTASSFGSLLGPGAAGAAADADDVDTGMTDEQVEALASANTSVQERDEEIAHIARSIEELAEIFKELNVLVVDQGTLLDRIDHNVDMTLDTVKDGVKHLETAEKYQKSARPMWCIGILMTLIVVMIIIIAMRKA